MGKTNLSFLNENKLLIAFLCVSIVLLVVLAVLIYKTCRTQNEIEPIVTDILEEKKLEEKKPAHESKKNKNSAQETSEVMKFVLSNMNLDAHLDNQTARYNYLSNQIANISNRHESEYSKFRKSIHDSLFNKNHRMLMTDEVRTVISFLDPEWEQIEIGEIDVARQLEDLEIVESNGKTRRENINARIAEANSHWNEEYNKIKKENEAEEQRVELENTQEKAKIESENAKLIEEYKKNNPQLFQKQNDEPIAQVQQNQQQSQQKTSKKKSPENLWEKFLNLFGLFNSKEEVGSENLNMTTQVSQQIAQVRENFDETKILGYKKFIKKEAKLKPLPEKPSDEGSPALLGNQLQGQYILHKKIYECIENGQESKLVIRVPGHYYHVKIERKNKNDINDKEVNFVIADSGGNGSLVLAHIHNILENGLNFVDGEERYTDEEKTSSGEDLIKFRPLFKSLDESKIDVTVTQDNCAKQLGGYECGLFSIYNGSEIINVLASTLDGHYMINREFFNEIGVNFETKTSYNDFNQKLHSTIYLLFRASLMYGYFESNILWNLKNQNNALDLDKFHKEILNETKALCKKFLESNKSSLQNWNKELIEFDEKFFNKVRDKIKNKLNIYIEDLRDKKFKNDVKNILKINFINNIKEILPDQSIASSANTAANLPTLTPVSI